MTDIEYYKARGYLAILEALPPNGRYVHRVRNKITGIRMSIHQRMALRPEYELEIRRLIREVMEKHTAPV